MRLSRTDAAFYQSHGAQSVEFCDAGIPDARKPALFSRGHAETRHDLLPYAVTIHIRVPHMSSWRGGGGS